MHRKGAINTAHSQFGIIPGSMGTSSYLTRGVGSPDSFFSCSHGAGRKCSRTQAKKMWSVDEFKTAMEGIHYEANKKTLDESPMAYKDIDDVMENQTDLVRSVRKLYPVAPLKAQ